VKPRDYTFNTLIQRENPTTTKGENERKIQKESTSYKKNLFNLQQTRINTNPIIQKRKRQMHRIKYELYSTIGLMIISKE